MLGATDERSQRAERRVGRILGDKWRLDRLIGMGGMAAVYSATHSNNLRPAAIKVLHRELSVKDDIRKRFLREGYIANKVGHPGAVAVLDDGSDEDGSVFLVMELLQGETLHALAKAEGGTLPVLEVLRVVDSLLDVLAAAHEAGVVHRDLKPENIFVTREGDVKVLDFGIARLLEAQKNDLTTQAGMLVGTPTFMPPEQVAGKMELIDGRTDIWAVGAMMFTLLSGKLVHEAKMGNALLLQAMTAPARKLTEVLPEVHPAVASVVDRALAFNREDRWPDARAMQIAVRDAAATGAARKGSPKTGIDLERHAPSSSRGIARRSFAALIALVLLGITAGFGAWMRRRYAGAFSLGPATSTTGAGGGHETELATLGDAGDPNAATGVGAGGDSGIADGGVGDGGDSDDGGEYDDDAGDEDCEDAGDCDDEDDAGDDEEDVDGSTVNPFIPVSPGAKPGAKPVVAPGHKLPPASASAKKPAAVKKPATKPRKPHRKKRRPRW